MIFSGRVCSYAQSKNHRFRRTRDPHLLHCKVGKCFSRRFHRSSAHRDIRSLMMQTEKIGYAGPGKPAKP
jgi:hypothetical protein